MDSGLDAARRPGMTRRESAQSILVIPGRAERASPESIITHVNGIPGVCAAGRQQKGACCRTQLHAVVGRPAFKASLPPYHRRRLATGAVEWLHGGSACLLVGDGDRLVLLAGQNRSLSL